MPHGRDTRLGNEHSRPERAVLSHDAYAKRAGQLYARTVAPQTEAALCLRRAVIETVRNPIVARAVAQGLRHAVFEKP